MAKRRNLSNQHNKKRPSLEDAMKVTNKAQGKSTKKRKNPAKGEKLTTALTPEHKQNLKLLAFKQNKQIADILEDALNHYFSTIDFDNL